MNDTQKLRQLQHYSVCRINQCYDLAERHFGKEIRRPRVEFSNKMTKTAGYVEFNKRTKRPVKLVLSNKLMMLNGDTFVNDTPAHEAAHVIELQIYGNGGHGRTWQYVMNTVLGQKANRCHSMATPHSARKRQTFKAFCGCMTHLITKNLRTRILNGSEYHCKRCHKNIRLSA